MTQAEDFAAQPELVQRLVKVLDAGVMPPPGAPRLARTARESILAELRSMLPEPAVPNGASFHVPVRRMNRFQYANAVQDLFDLRVEVFALPERMLRDYGYFRPETGKMPDDLKAGSRPLGKSQLIGKRLAGVTPFPQDLRAEHGYDNRADHLSLSPLLLESFLKLSAAVVESPDFNALTSGSWDWLFRPPADGRNPRATVRQALRRFLSLAFRRPVDEPTLDRYSDFALAKIDAGEPYAGGMRAAVSAALASPRFLYLHDGAPGRAADSFGLASRLSFFLWGSIPDQRLLDLAASGELAAPETLASEVDRLLRDVRLKRFCDSFASQWLQLERIVSAVPDADLFPDFYFAKYRASMHMMLEPLLLFETVLIENRPILDLVDSDFSYRSELLESWYVDGTRSDKVPPVAIPFRRVSLTDRRQGGVITTAAVMTMTSGPRETRPITRGAWIAGVVFNDPPDPPPPEVTPLAEAPDAEAQAAMTLRERLEAHRSRPDCASCHAQIDPLGFALENYGPTGAWRDRYENGRRVDAGGVLLGRHVFQDIVEFKDGILAEKDRFARAFAAHLLEFALGRELTAGDDPALDEIVRASAPSGYRMREMIKRVVLSAPFRAGPTGTEVSIGTH